MKSATLNPGEMGGRKVVLRLPWWRILPNLLFLLIFLGALDDSVVHRENPALPPTLSWPGLLHIPQQFFEGAMIVVCILLIVESLYKITRFALYRLVIDGNGIWEKTLWGSGYTAWTSVAGFFISDRTVDGIQCPMPTLLNVQGEPIFLPAPPATRPFSVKRWLLKRRATDAVAERLIQQMRDRGIAEVQASQ